MVPPKLLVLVIKSSLVLCNVMYSGVEHAVELALLGIAMA